MGITYETRYSNFAKGKSFELAEAFTGWKYAGNL
jgi:hypothetical protein